MTDIADRPIVEAPDELPEYRSLRSDVWRQFRRHKGAVIGFIVLSIIILAVYIGPFVSPFDPFENNVPDRNQGPSWRHLMGTDNLGRDVFTRVLWGGRISVSVGIAAMVFQVFVGTTIGVLAGFFRYADGILMRLTDLFLSIPQLPLLLLVISLFREPITDRFGESLGIFLLVVGIIGITNWMQTARIVRGDVLAIKEEEFVLAARSIGTGGRKIMTRHILPNVLSPVTVAASLGVAASIITESALSFLGLGFPANNPTWGRLLFDAKDVITSQPARVIWPGVMISITVLCVTFIGDGLRDALDPKLRSKG